MDPFPKAFELGSLIMAAKQNGIRFGKIKEFSGAGVRGKQPELGVELPHCEGSALLLREEREQEMRREAGLQTQEARGVARPLTLSGKDTYAQRDGKGKMNRTSCWHHRVHTADTGEAELGMNSNLSEQSHKDRRNQED